jgi:hypothetical protein
MDVKINIIFEQRENAFKFQTAIHRITRKRSSSEFQIIPTLEDEVILPISSIDYGRLLRIMTDDYEHQDESPPFTVTEHSHSNSESSSLQAEHVQNPRTNPEITLQMIERVDVRQLVGQIVESCHIQRKIEDPSNFLYLSRLFHQHFDGIDCPDPGVPNMLIHYVSHMQEPEQTPVQHITAYRTTIQIFFRDMELFNVLVPDLKHGGVTVIVNGKTAHQLDLFFENGSKAREYLKHKEVATLKIWNERASDHSFDFLLE